MTSGVRDMMPRGVTLERYCSDLAKIGMLSTEGVLDKEDIQEVYLQRGGGVGFPV